MAGGTWRHLAVATAVALALGSAVSSADPADAAPLSETTCAAPREPGPVTTRSLGTAVAGFPVNAAARAGNQVHVVSMDLEPPRVLTYDLGTGSVTASVDLPVGRRAWAITHLGGAVYVGLWNRPSPAPNVYRVDPTAGTAEPVGRVPSDLELWALAPGPDGLLYAGADRPEVAVLDPATGAVDTIALPAAAEAQVTDLAIVGTTLYASTRSGEARVYAVDLATRAVRVLHDAAADGLEGILTLAADGDRVLAGASAPEATALVLDAGTGAVLARGGVPDDTAIDAATFTPAGEALVTAKPSGRLLRVGDSGAEVLATPVGRSPTRALFADADGAVGVSAAETVWRWDGAAVDAQDLLSAGAVGGPVAVMSLAATPDGIAVGGNNRLQVHDAVTGDVRHAIVPGEPKDMVWWRDALHLALYPYGQLWAYRDGELTREADWDDRYNRPRDIEAAADQLLVGVHDDATEGGALVLVDPTTGRQELRTDALDGTGVATVSDAAGITVLGGESRDPRLRAIEPHTGAVLWDTAPAPGAGEIAGVAAYRDELHVVTKDGTYLVLSRVDGSLRHRADVLEAPAGEVVVNGGAVYAVGRDRLVRIDADDRSVTTVVDGLAGHLFERPRLAIADDCAMYVVRGPDLLEVRV